MSRMIFVNLPVTDLAKSTAFYEAIGGEKEPKFSNDAAAMIRFSDTIHVMLLTHDFYKTFTPKPIGDAHAASLSLVCLSADSKADVDAMVAKAEGAGGKPDIGPKQEFGDQMYGRSFEDPDGHHWEVMWMDAAAAEAGAASLENA
jgi:predicted lactoylglutathione lyase